MKKYLVILSVVLLFAAVIYAADSSSVAPRGLNTIPDRFGGVVTLIGKTPRTTPVNVDNIVRTLDNIIATGGNPYLGGSDNTLTPIAATISCPDNATRWAFDLTPSTTVGHKLAAGTWWQFSGPDALALLKGVNNGATDNASCTITLWY